MSPGLDKVFAKYNANRLIIVTKRPTCSFHSFYGQVTFTWKSLMRQPCDIGRSQLISMF